uniref:Putative ovule protein n=1 Tax=Solanum chacoense TaxID=4108 RepID=A0A0V0HD02_SOLCH
MDDQANLSSLQVHNGLVVLEMEFWLRRSASYMLNICKSNVVFGELGRRKRGSYLKVARLDQEVRRVENNVTKDQWFSFVKIGDE